MIKGKEMMYSIRKKYEPASSSTREPPTADSSTYEDPVKNAINLHFQNKSLSKEPHILLDYGGESSTPKVVGLLLPMSDLSQITNASLQKLNSNAVTSDFGQSHLYCIYFKRFSRSHLEYVIRLFMNNSFSPGSGFNVKSVAIGYFFQVADLYNFQIFESWNALQILGYCYSGGENLKELIIFLVNHCGIDPAKKTPKGSNALHLLSRYYRGRASFLNIVIRFLVDKCGIEPKAKSKDGWDAFLIICHYYGGDNLREILDYFIQQGYSLNEIDIEFTRSAFVSVCKNYRGNDLKLVLELLLSTEKKNDVINSLSDITQGINALQILCNGYEGSDNLKEIVTLLIQKGIKVNFREEKHGWNALHFLCGTYFGTDFSDIAIILCRNGIDVNDLTNDGHNVFFTRCHRYDYKIPSLEDITTLIDQGLNVRAIAKRNDKNLPSLLGRVACHNSSDFSGILRMLYDNGFFESIPMFEHECELLTFLCIFYRGPELLEIVSRITEEIRKKYHSFWADQADILLKDSFSSSRKQSEWDLLEHAANVVGFMKGCVASALFFLRVYNLDLDRIQVVDHMKCFYDEIRSDDDPSADSEDLITYLRTERK